MSFDEYSRNLALAQLLPEDLGVIAEDEYTSDILRVYDLATEATSNKQLDIIWQPEWDEYHSIDILVDQASKPTMNIPGFAIAATSSPSNWLTLLGRSNHKVLGPTNTGLGNSTWFSLKATIMVRHKTKTITFSQMSYNGNNGRLNVANNHPTGGYRFRYDGVDDISDSSGTIEQEGWQTATAGLEDHILRFLIEGGNTSFTRGTLSLIGHKVVQV